MENIIEQLKNKIESNYFQKDIKMLFENKNKINKKIKINRIIGYSLLGLFILIGIIILCFINIATFRHANIILSIAGISSVLLGVFLIFIPPIFNFKMLSKIFVKKYNIDKQNEYLKLAFNGVDDINIENIKFENNHLLIKLVFDNQNISLKYLNDKVKLANITKDFQKEKNISHNLNQLIKIYSKDIDRNSFADIDSFTLCVEIKIKKLAKLIVTDLITLNRGE